MSLVTVLKCMPAGDPNGFTGSEDPGAGKKNSPGDPPCMVERPDLTPVLALGWVGLRSPEARLPLPESLPVVIPLPFSLGEALSPSLVSVVGSARP